MNDRFIDTLSPKERATYDSYTKEQIYEAFVSESIARKKETERANKIALKIKEIQFKLQQLVTNCSK